MSTTQPSLSSSSLVGGGLAEATTLIEVLDRRAQASPNAAFLSAVKAQKGKEPVIINHSYRAATKKIFKLADYLRRQGVKQGDAVAVISDNCPEDIIAMLAVVYLGALLVPLYPFDLTTPVLQYQLENSEVSAVLYENNDQLERLGELPEAIHLALPFSEFDSIFNDPLLCEMAPTLEIPITGDSLLLHLYTSGSSGTPKGVVRTHASIVENVKAFSGHEIFKKGDRVLAILPVPHIFPFDVVCCAPYFQVALVLTNVGPARRARKNPIAMRTAWMLGECDTLPMVPKILRKIKEGIEKKIEGNKIASFAVSCLIAAYAVKVDRWIRKGLIETPKGFIAPTTKQRLLAPFAPLFHGVARKITAAALGPNARQIASGGSALAYEVGAFFEALLIAVLEGYGTTEDGIGWAQAPDGVYEGYHRVPGNVGLPLSAAVEYFIDDELGLLTRSPFKMKEYHKRQEATAERLVERYGQLWQVTSDNARFSDKLGSLVIDGRSDRQYTNDGGLNIQPEETEELLCNHPAIDAAVMYGNNKPRNIVVVSVDPVVIKERIKAAGKAASLDSILATLKVELLNWAKTNVNPRVESTCAVSEILIAPEGFTVENGLLSGNKVRYKFVIERFAEEIQAYYQTFKK